MIRDFDLPYVDLLNGFVVSPVNSISQHSRMPNKYLELFTTKGLYKFIEEDSRCKLLGPTLDKTFLDLVLQIMNV